MAQSIVVEISETRVRLGTRTYAPDENIESQLLDQMRPHLDGFLEQNESRAAAVGHAIEQLHALAINECLQAEKIRSELADLTIDLSREEFKAKHNLMERLRWDYYEEWHDIRHEKRELSP